MPLLQPRLFFVLTEQAQAAAHLSFIKPATAR
jgi:hypothetical protein